MLPLQEAENAAARKKPTKFRLVVFPRTKQSRPRWKKLQTRNGQLAPKKLPDVSVAHKSREPEDAKGQSQDEDELPQTLANASEYHTRTGSCSSQSTDSLSPISILQKGSSDPFSALAIPISPTVNKLMTFCRDYTIPSLYSLSTHAIRTSASAMRDWRGCVDSLRDPCSGYAYMARHATICSFVSSDPDLPRLALIYRNRSTALLREKLASLQDGEGRDQQLFQSYQTYEQIKSLFDAEVIGRNYTAAQVHGHMLRLLFEKHFDKLGEIDLTLVTYVLWHDTQLAAMFLTRPTFDYDDWIPKVYKNSWEMAQALVPDVSLTGSQTFLDPSIDSETLKNVFHMRRLGVEVWTSHTSSMKNRKDEKSESASLLILGWLQSYVHICQARLINHYLDANEALVANPTANSLRAQAYLSLAALYFTKAIGSTNPTVGGVPLYNAGPKILEELRRVLNDTLQDTYAADDTTDNEGKYGNAMLWALYVGASAEQAQKLQRPKAEDTRSNDSSEAASKIDEDGWFTTHFAVQALTMGLFSWPTVCKILKGFLFTDHMQPHGSEWFWKAMSASLERHSSEPEADGTKSEG